MRGAEARIAVLVALAFSTGCKPGTPDKKVPAASSDRKVGERDVARITLTPEAELRLGLVVVAVEVRPVLRTRLAGGEVVVPSGNALTLAAPVAATVTSAAKLMIGLRVKRGDTLMRLVPLAPVDRDLRAQADRQMAAAEARLSAAQARLGRNERLLADGAGSARLVEEARADRDVARADVEAAKKRVAGVLGQPLSADVGVNVRAPFDGVVRQVGASPGQLVTAGAMLAEVVSSDAAWVRVPLFVAEAHRIKRDAPARVAPFGSVDWIDVVPAAAPPSADAAAGTIDLTYMLASSSGFRPGERVEVELPRDGADDAHVVPASAILRDVEGGAWVYERTAEHTYARRRVIVARVANGVAELDGGPRAGALVVRDGASELWGVELGAGK